MNNERNNKRRWNSNNDFGIRKSGIHVEVKNGQFERAMRKFKKKVTEAGIIQEVGNVNFLLNQVRLNERHVMLDVNVG